MKRIAIIFLVNICISNITWADETPATDQHTTPGSQASISSSYTSLIVDGGVNILQNCPDQLKVKGFHSNFLNGALLHHVRISKTPFTIGGGVGIGSDCYTLSQKEDTNYYVLDTNLQENVTKFSTTKKLIPDSEATYVGLCMRYFDIIGELRFNSNLIYPKDGVSVAIGFFASPMLIGASQTVCYNTYKKRIDIDTFNLNKVRYGGHLRIGWNRISFFGAVTGSSFFDKDGPLVNAKPYRFGISLDLF